MSFVAAAVIGGGVALLGGAMQANAAGKAGSLQAGAANRATDANLAMFDTINKQQAPYRQAGYNSLDAIMHGFGMGGKTYDQDGNIVSAPTKAQFTKTVPGSSGSLMWGPNSTTSIIGATKGSSTFDEQGYNKALDAFNASQTPYQGPVDSGYFAHQFDANDLNDHLAPNYAFMRDQGLGAVRNAGNLQTGLLSGNTLKGINDYAMNYAGNAYQQAFQNYTANQSNIFNRLSSIAGLGQTANQATGSAGTQLVGNAGQAMMAGGAAQAAGAVGQANAIAGGMNNAMGWYTLPDMMKWASENG